MYFILDPTVSCLLFAVYLVNFYVWFYRADLANLVNEAALLAGRKSKMTVEKVDFIQAVERSIAVSSYFF